MQLIHALIDFVGLLDHVGFFLHMATSTTNGASE